MMNTNLTFFLILLLIPTTNHYAMEKHLEQIVPKSMEEEPKFWSTKKSHEKNPRRLKEELAQKIDLDELACQITYNLSLMKQTGMVKFSTDKDPTTHEFRKKEYYGRKINALLVNASCSDRNHEVVKKLLENKANPNVKIYYTDLDGSNQFYTPLSLAVESAAEKNVALLLQIGARTSTKVKNGNTPLHLACSISPYNHSEMMQEIKKNMVRLLLAHGADPNMLNAERHNCLYSFVASGSWKQSDIALLLEYGLNARTEFPGIICTSLDHSLICNFLALYARRMTLFRVLWKRAQNSDFKRLPRELALHISELVYHDSPLPKICIANLRIVLNHRLTLLS